MRKFWNYRVIKTPDKKLPGLKQTYSWGVHEVYYINKRPASWSAEPIKPIGETFEGLDDDFGRMQAAFRDTPLKLVKGKLVECKRIYK